MNRAEYLVNARLYCKRGFELPQTKLPPLAIVAIRQAAKRRVELRKEINDTLSNAALAKQWGVHERTIEKVLNYTTAKHIP
jgi:hypothetical protein